MITISAAGETVDIFCPPVGDLPGLRQIYLEDFTTDMGIGAFTVAGKGAATEGLVLPTAAAATRYGKRVKFYCDGHGDTYGITRAYPSKSVSVHDSCLDVWLHSENVNGVLTPMGSWIRPISNPLTELQTYGRWAYRIRCDPVPGFGVCCLLIGKVWPRCGEWDFPEGDPSKPGIRGYCHYADALGGQRVINLPDLDWSVWHEFVLDWAPGLARWFVDDRCVFESTDRVPTEPLKFVIQTGGSDYGGKTPPAPDVSGHLLIDYVAVWERT